MCGFGRGWRRPAPGDWGARHWLALAPATLLCVLPAPLRACRETDGQPLAFCGMHSKARFERTRTALTEGREALYDEAEGGSAGEEEEGEGGQVRGAVGWKRVGVCLGVGRGGVECVLRMSG